MATLVAIARDARVSRATSATGPTHGAAVHRLDSARLFRLAVETAPAGSALHAVADEGVAIRDIAEVIGRHLDIPVALHLTRGRGRAFHVAWPGSSGPIARRQAR